MSRRVRIRPLSDLHFNRREIELPDVAADLVVLAGDIHCGTKGVIEAKSRFPGSPVLYVLGNHEYYHQDILRTVQAMEQAAAGSNVHILERRSIELCGVAFFGCTLWTDFNLTGDAAAAKQSWRSESSRIWFGREDVAFSPELALQFHQLSLEALKQASAAAKGRLVIITHHAPSRRSLSEAQLGKPSAGAFAVDCEKLIEQSGAVLWIHGHTHRHVDYRIGRTRILSNPLGYEKEKDTGFDPTLCIEV